MKTLSLAIVLLCCAIAGCDGPDIIDDSNLQRASTIRGDNVDIIANVGRAVYDRPVTITVQCMPLVTGSGVIQISSEKDNDSFTWVLISPVEDTVTIYRGSHYWIAIPAEFKAGQMFEQRWTIQLLPNTTDSHLFTGSAYVDSIFIADSSRMYGIESDVARKHCPRPLGWEPNAISSNNVYLQP
jgi:hypothetical protein